MPAHNWRRCLVDDAANRHVKYHLNAANSSFKADGSAAVLTGADGDVMVEIAPVYYRLDHYTDAGGHYHEVWLVSTAQFTGSAAFDWFRVGAGGATVRTQYVSAFPAVLCNAAGAALTTAEAADTPAAYASGYRLRSVAGAKAGTNMTLGTMRAAAAANGGRIVNAAFYEFLAVMMAIEHGTFDLQSAFSPGFTNASTATAGYSYLRLSGRANFGNGSGHILADAIADAAIAWQSGTVDAAKVVQCTYRGIQDPYGGIWQMADGFIKVADGYYRTLDPSLYSDANYATTYAKVALAWPAAGGFISAWLSPSLLPTAAAGSSTTGLCDYYNYGSSVRRLLRGGSLTEGAYRGPNAVNIASDLNILAWYIGTRIAC